jgi:pimeloyl-ACP methyl ester carboxylesterase
MNEIAHRFAEIDGARIHYVEAGSGPAVVLLHGFPEFWFSWREQLPALAAAGFRAIAPDLRGYNDSHRPRDLDRYRITEIADEMAALMRMNDAALLVGHDWGGLAAWILTMRHPSLVKRLAILNTPHPSAIRRGGFRQLSKLYYQFIFQLPLLPELMLGRRHFALLKRAVKVLHSNRNDLQLERYVEAWSKPGALTAMLAYYRALFQRKRDLPRGDQRIVRAPTLLIWGERDPVFLESVMTGTARYAPDFRLERLPRANHFVQQDDPDRVNELLIEFLRRTE